MIRGGGGREGGEPILGVPTNEAECCRHTCGMIPSSLHVKNMVGCDLMCIDSRTSVWYKWGRLSRMVAINIPVYLVVEFPGMS